MKYIVFLFTLLASFIANAYPDFIGFGYRTCIACHYSSTGGGALTDYGRGVYAGEIADNPISSSMSDDELSSISSFLIIKESPYWFKPGFKQRKLHQVLNPGSAKKTEQTYSMQDQFNLNFFIDPKSQYGLISTLAIQKNENWIHPHDYVMKSAHLFWQEYFIRIQASKKLWISAGLIDKTFGIKHPDHTAVNRSKINIGQNDQVHGLLTHWADKEFDAIIHVWQGNLSLEEINRKSGGSLFGEAKIFTNHAIGFSILNEKNKSSQQTTMAIHTKFSFDNGHSFLMEVGSNTLNDFKQGYAFSQGSIKLRRGLFLRSAGEYYKNDITTQSAENMIWKLGLLWFPIQRIELHLTAINSKQFNATEMSQDQWALQSQLHLSL